MKLTPNPNRSVSPYYLAYLIPATIFIALAIAVVSHRQIWFDQPIMQFFGNLRSPNHTVLFHLITDVGSTPVVLVSVAILGFGLISKRKHFELGIITAGVLGAVVLAYVFKVIIGRVRPSYLSHLVVETGQSFPSGHSLISSAFALAIIYLVWNTKWRYLALTLGVMYALAVGASRIYLGVHYPSDVLAGWCLSLLLIGAIAHWYIPFAKASDIAQ
ncbi:phosphatase PAP2 family protein [Candidatus Saccharibacteria bacterium]|nr:phosphatase PAP2 family protein [Candidatus Saccharibacteria bacterium]